MATMPEGPVYEESDLETDFFTLILVQLKIYNIYVNEPPVDLGTPPWRPCPGTQTGSYWRPGPRRTPPCWSGALRAGSVYRFDASAVAVLDSLGTETWLVFVFSHINGSQILTLLKPFKLSSLLKIFSNYWNCPQTLQNVFGLLKLSSNSLLQLF